MEIEQDVSRTVDSVDDVNTHHRYQPRAALGSVWEVAVSTATAEVVHGWLDESGQAAQGAGIGDLR